MNRLTLTAVFAVTIILSGCGYTLYGMGSSDSAQAHRNVYVSVIRNDTMEPMLDRELTRSLKKEIMQDGRWRLTGPDDAEYSLEGAVKSFKLDPLSYDPRERILEYRVSIKVSLVLKDASSGDVLWKDPDMESFAEYRVTQDITKSKIKKGEAIAKACKILAESFIIKAVDNPL